MRGSPEEHQKFISFFLQNMKKIPQKMLDSFGGGDILKTRFWKN